MCLLRPLRAVIPLLFVVVVGLGAETAKADDFWVDPLASDSNDGMTAATAFATIQHAVDLAQAGDVIHLAPGNYLQNVVSRRAGAVAAPITLTGPPAAVVRGSGGSHIFDIHHDHLTLEGFTIDGLWGSPTSAAGYRDKLLFAIGTAAHDGVTDLHLLSMTFRNAGGECVRLRYFAQNNEIAHSSFTGCGVYDFVFFGGGKNGEAIYIGTAPEQRRDGKNPTADPDESDNNWIHHNTFDTGGNECVDIKETASGNLVEHNVCTGQSDPSSGGFDARGNNNIIRYNQSFGNRGAGVRFGGDSSGDGIDNDIYGNDIHDNAAGGIKFMRSPQGSVCGNTMADNVGGDSVGTFGAQFDPTEPCGVCGNGIQEMAEFCDDGNLTDNDGCDSNCTQTGCGNGIVTSGESCDDRNQADGDCCSSLCQLDANGSSCSDDNPCTHSDQCSAGVCLSSTMPLPSCRTAARSLLQVKDRSTAAQDRLAFTWRKGSATSLAEFGDPVLGTTNYTLCLYDETAPDIWAARSAIAVAPGGACAGKPCWSATRIGYLYRDREATAGGLQELILRPGESGRAEIRVKAKGKQLAPPSLPLVQTSWVVVQLASDTGICWEASYDASVSRNDDEQFKAVGHD